MIKKGNQHSPDDCSNVDKTVDRHSSIRLAQQMYPLDFADQ
jgi:hypothetical protein